jgi:hypothetical protein
VLLLDLQEEVLVLGSKHQIAFNLPKVMIISQLPTTTFPTDVTLIIKDLGLQGESLTRMWHLTRLLAQTTYIQTLESQ